MKRELSVLIPVFNDRCSELVRELAEQAAAVPDLRYEIVIGDDGSTDNGVVEDNRRAAEVPNGRYIRLQENRGRAAIRNALADAAKYSWLLFIDGGHMRVRNDDYLVNYLVCDDLWRVVYGGYSLIEPSMEIRQSNLRYKYESHVLQNMSAELRRAAPQFDFHSSNFLAHKSVFSLARFDERLVDYGYEDVLFGKELTTQGIEIQHIDNPTAFGGFEDNAKYLRKTMTSLCTLKEFERELDGYSRMASNARLCRQLKIDRRLRELFRRRSARWQANLEGPDPSLLVFRLFKLGYFLSL